MPKGLELSFDAVLAYSHTSLQALSEELQGFDWSIVDIYAGCETGVELSDELSHHMGLRSNGTSGSELRRNKYVNT